jgi:sugar phosphate isomerase/epimerase
MTKLALQLYSLRHEAEKNPDEVVLQVPGLGFDAVELASDFGWSNDKWVDMLAQTKLKVVGAHAMLSDLEAKFDSLMEYYLKVGNPRVIVPWLEEKWRTPEGFLETAKQLNKWAPKVRELGMTLLYHNHDFEFQKLADGSIGYDILLENTDPALVGFQVDTYWIQKSGRDAFGFLKQNEGRVLSVHAKEMRGSDKTDTAAGQGVINFKEIVPLAVKNKWPVVVEYEGVNAVEVVRQSAQYLSQL